MAKKRKVTKDDVPGIYSKSETATLKSSDRPLTPADKVNGRQVLESEFVVRPFADRLADLASVLNQWAAMDDEPASAKDARCALMELRQIKQILDRAPLTRTKAEQLVDYSMRLGETVEKMQIRTLDETVKNGRRNSKTQGNRTRERVITDSEWEKVAAYIHKRWKKEGVAAPACRDAAHQLFTGIFRGINKRIEITDGVLANRFSSWKKANGLNR